MKTQISRLARGGLIAALMTGLINVPSFAGSISAPGVDITWDDSRMNEPNPNECRQYYFNYTKSGSSDEMNRVYIENGIGATVSSTAAVGRISAPTGTFTLQICGGKDYSNTRLVVSGLYYKQLTTTPITIFPRVVTPAPTTQTPTAPAPTTPAPNLDPSAKAAAASAYLAIICPSNAAVVRYEAAVTKAERAGMKEGSKIPTYLVNALRQTSKADAAAARQLMSYQWPNRDLTGDAKQLAEGMFSDASEADQIAARKKWETADWADLTLYTSRMRLMLGLPPAGQGCPKK